MKQPIANKAESCTQDKLVLQINFHVFPEFRKIRKQDQNIQKMKEKVLDRKR